MKKTNVFIKWSGSKRLQAPSLIEYFPKKIDTYFEPFLGGGSIMGTLKPKKAVGGDVYKPLIDLWLMLKSNPTEIISNYSKDWNLLQEKGHTHYYKVRDRFNVNKQPSDLLFLSRTCVNGMIRFNSAGDFNNSLHHSRPGIHPKRLEKIINEWSVFISDYSFVCRDYVDTTKGAGEGDFVYLDPPYFNTKNRYIEQINYQKFLDYLEDLNKRNVRFALSFDGTRGEESYLVDLPKHLYKKHLLLDSGLSTFNKVQNGKNEKVKESLYLNY